MTLSARILAALQQVGADVKGILNLIGDLSTLTTTSKTSIVTAINEVKSSGGGSGPGLTFHELDLDFGAGSGKAVMSSGLIVTVAGALTTHRVLATPTLLVDEFDDGSDDLELDPIIAYGMVTEADTVKIWGHSLGGPIFGKRKVIFVVG